MRTKRLVVTHFFCFLVVFSQISCKPKSNSGIPASSLKSNISTNQELVTDFYSFWNELIVSSAEFSAYLYKEKKDLDTWLSSKKIANESFYDSKIFEYNDFRMLSTHLSLDMLRFTNQDATPLDALVLAFRGTIPKVSNYLADLDNSPTSFASGKVHRGFLGAYQKFKSDLHQDLHRMFHFRVQKDEQKISRRFLILTGHSLGAAMSQMAALDLCSKESVIRKAYGYECVLFAYGSPKNMDQDNKDFLNSMVYKFSNFIMDQDPIGKYPLRANYVQAGDVFRYCDSAYSKLLPVNLDYHSMDLYLQVIQKEVQKGFAKPQGTCPN